MLPCRDIYQPCSDGVYRDAFALHEWELRLEPVLTGPLEHPPYEHS